MLHPLFFVFMKTKTNNISIVYYFHVEGNNIINLNPSMGP